MVFQIYIIITDYHSDGMADFNKTASDQRFGDILFIITLFHIILLVLSLKY